MYTLSAFLLVISIVVGFVGYYSNKNVVDEYSKITSINLPNIQAIGDMASAYRSARVRVTEVALSGLKKEQTDKILERYDSDIKSFMDADKKYNDVPFGPGEEEIYKDYKAKFDDVKTSFDKVINLYKKNPEENSAERKQMLSIISTEVSPKADLLREASAKLKKYHNDAAKVSIESAQSISAKGTMTTLAVIMIGSFVGIVFAVTFSNGLVNILTRISDSLNAAGVEVSSGSTQIASTAQELSQSTTEQSASLQQTAASIEEMTSMVQKNAENAKKTYEFAANSKESAIEGKGVVVEMISSIKEINVSNQHIMDSIDESNKKMEEIAKVIGDIGTKTKVINDIVFQTKLLSFNASVEAARAGEQGKGFAVVAEEVGNLATMSGKAAQEITEMLDGSIAKVDEIVKATKEKVERLVGEGKRKVEAGTAVASKCGDVLEKIVENIEDVNRLAGEISNASDEQAKGISEISKAAGMLDTVTQQNSSASEQAASAAEELSAQAHSLNKLVSELVVTINGGEQTHGGHSTSLREDNVLAMKRKQKVQPSSPKFDDKRFMDA